MESYCTYTSVGTEQASWPSPVSVKNIDVTKYQTREKLNLQTRIIAECFVSFSVSSVKTNVFTVELKMSNEAMLDQIP